MNQHLCRIRTLFFFALICLTVSFAFAEAPCDMVVAKVDTPRYVNPFEVVVTAARAPLAVKNTPAAISVVEPSTLKMMPRTVAVDEALRLVPGVRIDNQANGSRVHLSIRGQGILTERGIRGVKVLLDGLPVNDPTGFAPDFYDVDWATVEHIEVLRGPAAALYGGGSSAGVINIETQNGSDEPVTGSVMGTAGSHDFWKSLAQLSGTQNDVNYRASASRMMGDGYRDHQRFWGNNFYLKTRVHTGGLELAPIFAGTDFYNDNAEGLNLEQVAENRRMANPDSDPKNEGQRTGRYTLGLVGKTSVTKNQDLQWAAFYRHTQFMESVPSAVQHRDMTYPGLSAQYTLHLGESGFKNHVSVAGDFGSQTIKEHRNVNLGDAQDGAIVALQTIQQKNVGVSLLDRIEITRQWGGQIGLRYDAITNKLTDHFAQPADLSGSKNFNHATARAGVTYAMQPEANFYASVGQGFLPPATEELVNNPVHQGGFNTSLEAATSLGEEIGARGTVSRQFTYDATLFYLNTDKDFDRYRMSDRPQETFYRNSGSSRRFGLETALAWSPLNPLTVQLAYTYSNFKYTKPTELKNNWLPNSPQHQIELDAEYHVDSHLTLGAASETQTKWQIDSQNSVAQKGFTLVHARAAYQWQMGTMPCEISVNARNIFGEKYIAFTEPDPDGNSYQPGPQQEVFAGLRLSF